MVLLCKVTASLVPEGMSLFRVWEVLNFVIIGLVREIGIRFQAVERHFYPLQRVHGGSLAHPVYT